jgi:hypothetical protein
LRIVHVVTAVATIVVRLLIICRTVLVCSPLVFGVV